jgi:ParB family transcriptional regulator, chromosome partitioning protein
MLQKLEMVPLESCRFSNIRTVLNEEELRQLGESLKIRQIHPIVMRTDRLVIDGERRVRAGLLVGLKELLAIITDEELTANQITTIQFVSAFHRADLTGYEKWQAMLAIKAAEPNATNKELADRLGIDPKMVKVLLSPSACPPAAQEGLRAGTLGISDCYELSKNPLDQQDGLLALKLGGASRDELARHGRSRRNGNTAPSVRVPKLKVCMTSGVVITIAGGDLSLEDAAKELSEAAAQMRRAEKDGFTAKTFQNVMRDKAKAVG